MTNHAIRAVAVAVVSNHVVLPTMDHAKQPATAKQRHLAVPTATVTKHTRSALPYYEHSQHSANGPWQTY